MGAVFKRIMTRPIPSGAEVFTKNGRRFCTLEEQRKGTLGSTGDRTGWFGADHESNGRPSREMSIYWE